MSGEKHRWMPGLVRKLEGKGSLNDPGVNGRIILKCILK